jgi:polyisoprenoid-binding protein YceI
MLQRVAVTSTRVAGYVVAPFAPEEGAQPPVLAGAFRLPVASLRTGIDGGDRQLRDASILDAGRHPEITFLVTGLRDVKRLHHDQESTRFEATLSGTLTVKDAPRPWTLPVSLSFMPSTERLMARADGDLLVLEGHAAVALRALGYEPPPELRDRVAEEIQVEIRLLLSTLSPDQPPDPRDDRARHLERSRILTLLQDFDDPAAAAGRARAHMKQVWDQPADLRRLARALAGVEGLRPSEWALAREAAQRSVTLTREQDARSLDTLALVHHGMGDRAAAVQWQRKAVARAAATDARMARRMRGTLAGYEGTK